MVIIRMVSCLTAIPRFNSAYTKPPSTMLRAASSAAPKLHAFMPFTRGNQAQQSDDPKQSNRNAQNHLIPNHAKAHSYAQPQRPQDANQNDENRFPRKADGALMLHFAPYNQGNYPHKQANAAQRNARPKGSPFLHKRHTHSQGKQHRAHRSQYHCGKAAFLHSQTHLQKD